MNRTILLMVVVSLATAAAVSLIPASPRPDVGVPAQAYPYVPLSIVPGMSAAAVADCLAQHRVQVNPACLRDGVLRPGTVEASTADHRLTVYTDFTPAGAVSSVKFRVMASPATLAQLDQLAGSRYQASGWRTPDAAMSQATYVNDAKQVTVYHLFECDPLYDGEPYYFAMDLTEHTTGEHRPAL
jgi:hypothetical protein